jgi:hypothetical protein
MKHVTLTREQVVHRILSQLNSPDEVSDKKLVSLHGELFPPHEFLKLNNGGALILSLDEEDEDEVPKSLADLITCKDEEELDWGVDGQLPEFLIFADSEFVGIRAAESPHEAVALAKQVYKHPNGISHRTFDNKTHWTTEPIIDLKVARSLGQFLGNGTVIKFEAKDGMVFVKFPKPKGKRRVQATVSWPLINPGDWELNLVRSVRDDFVISASLWEHQPEVMIENFAKFGASLERNVQDACEFLVMLKMVLDGKYF